jgi:carboxylate-amine ligase
MDAIPFKKNIIPLTIGVELEFQVLDQSTLLLTPRTTELLQILRSPVFEKEFFQSTVEVISGVSKSVHQVQEFFERRLPELRQAGSQLGITFASTGTHPRGDYRDRLVTPSDRYHQLIDRNQWLIRRMAVYGMHIHLGMKSGDDCIRYNNFFMHFIPHLLALSGSSPFWQGMHTGLNSCRPTTYEALPTAGMPYLVKTWDGFQRLFKFLHRSGSVQSIKDLWWDIRPSPAYGTVELRICDGPATLEEAMAIVAFVHALGAWFSENGETWEKSNSTIKRWIARENKWRAIRYGLEADFIHSRSGGTIPLKADIDTWLLKLDPYYKRFKYNQHLDAIGNIVTNGNSSQRQTRMFGNTNSLDEVVKMNVREFVSGKPERVAP